MSKFTPGEWRADDYGGYVFAHGEDMMICQMRGAEYLRSKGVSEEGIIAVQEANARLIAAAPEMYGELYEALQLCEGKSSYDGDEFSEQAKSIRELLARIDGEEGRRMTEKLKPCPFCGGRAELCTKLSEGFRTFWVCCCENCFAYTLHVSSLEAAVELWNRRVSDD